jgi:hypothetical protein
MRPTLRIVDDANVGAITGEVDSALVGEQCKPTIYVFQGGDVIPDDIEEANVAGDIDPLVVVGVPVVNGSTAYSYRAAFLPPGTYTVAFTCDDDDPVLDQTLTFLTPKNVTVQTNLIATANFAPPAP